MLKRARGGDETGAFLAVLGGCWRAAPLGRGGGGNWGQRHCVCGYAGDDVDLHAVMNETETACSNRGLNEARSRWRTRVLHVLPAHVIRETRNGSRQRLALMMGSPRPLTELGVTAWKRHLKEKHQKALLLAFADT